VNQAWDNAPCETLVLSLMAESGQGDAIAVPLASWDCNVAISTLLQTTDRLRTTKGTGHYYIIFRECLDAICSVYIVVKLWLSRSTRMHREREEQGRSNSGNDRILVCPSRSEDPCRYPEFSNMRQRWFCAENLKYSA
jgi:hypothetical protein